MKIAINTRFLLKNMLEGIGRFTYEISRRLVEQHPEIEFYFFFDRPYDKDFIFGPNVTPLVLSPPARHPFLQYAWYEWSVARMLAKKKIDVFFSPDNFLSLSTKTPTVLAVHDVAYKHFPGHIPYTILKYYQVFQPYYVRKAKKIITVSNFTKEDLIFHFRLPEKKIFVAHNGLQSELSPLSPDEIQNVRKKYAGGIPYFFYVGAIHPRKNIAKLINAFDHFKKSTGAPHKLLIAGRKAWKTNQIDVCYDRASSKDDIHFLGPLDEIEFPRLLGSAFALVFVSLFEGFGMPLLEAMQCGVPVITSNTSSMPEVAGNAALLADPHSIKSISDKMSEICHNEKLRKELIKRGHYNLSRFSWDKSAEIVYSHILSLG